MPDLNLIKQRLRDCPYGFICILCNEHVPSMTSAEAHYKRCHALKPITSCIWCFGRHTWPYGQKSQNEQHLLECFEKHFNTLKAQNRLTIGESYSAYRKYLDACEEPLVCRLCPERFLAKEMEAHSQRVHGIDPSIQCTWCGGEYRWPKGQKTAHALHLRACFEQFRRREVLPLPETFRYDVSLTSLASSFYDQRPVLEDWEYLDFGFEQELEPGEHAVPFSVPGIELGCRIVRLFAADGDQYRWFHAIVRAMTMDNFRDLLRARPDVSVLPFSCWCAGGSENDDRIRHHRHMILRVRSDRYDDFKTGWRALREGLDMGNMLCAKKIPIEGSLHLINTIHYVSTRRSECKMSGDLRTRDNHFAIRIALPECFAMCAVTCLQGLLVEYLKQLNRKKYLTEVHKQAFRDGGWKIKIKHLPALEMNTVLPVQRGWRPSNHETPNYMWAGENVVYFEWDPEFEILPQEEWVQRQGQLGNAFFACVGEEYYKLSATQTREMKCMKEAIRLEHLELWEDPDNWEYASALEKQVKMLKTENAKVKEERDEFKKEIKVLKREGKLRRMRKREKELLLALQQRVLQKEIEIAGLRAEKAVLQNEVEMRRRERAVNMNVERAGGIMNYNFA